MLSISFFVFILSVAIGISQGVIFDCNFHLYTVEIIGTRYTCRTDVSASESGKVLENVHGNHLEGKNNLDVEFLNFVRQDLPFIPKEIVKFFPNIKGFRYENTNLASISSDDLRPFPQLLFFRVLGGDLVSLDGNLLQHNLNLQFVGFIDNKIEHVGHNLLSELNQLQRAHFRSNVCVDMDANSLEDIRELKEQLPILCPQSEFDECTDQLLNATERIAELEKENRENNDQLLLCVDDKSDLSLEIKKLNERNAELEEENRENNDQLLLCVDDKSDLLLEIIKLKDRIKELELLGYTPCVR